MITLVMNSSSWGTFKLFVTPEVTLRVPLSVFLTKKIQSNSGDIKAFSSLEKIMNSTHKFLCNTALETLLKLSRSFLSLLNSQLKS